MFPRLSLLPRVRVHGFGRGRVRDSPLPHERNAAMTAAIFLISLNLLLVGSLAIRGAS
jgi:hypothetical protein